MRKLAVFFSKSCMPPRIFLSGTPANSVDFYVGDSVCLPFKTGVADAIFGFGFLHHVPDWRRALWEVARVLKPNGIYYIEELYPALYQNAVTRRILLHPEHDRFTSDDLRTAMDTSGLRLVDAVEMKMMGILGVAVKKNGPIYPK